MWKFVWVEGLSFIGKVLIADCVDSLRFKGEIEEFTQRIF
jgi:hypothetical protein